MDLENKTVQKMYNMSNTDKVGKETEWIRELYRRGCGRKNARC